MFPLPRNQTLILAISGGPDSIFLLDKIAQVQNRNNLKIIIAHLNHQIRGTESDKDELFVIKTAKKYQIPFEVKKINVPEYAKKYKLNLEQAARNARYAFLSEIAEKNSAKYILTAHHQDDNIETVLFKFFRGCNLKSLTGMSQKQNISVIYNEKIYHANILRPLLNTQKKEILDYLRKNKIKFCIDKSNFDTKLKRNFRRHNLIPQIEQINPEFNKKFPKTIENFSLIENFIQQEIKKWLKLNFKKSSFPMDLFNLLHPYIRQEIIKNLFYKFSPHEELSSTHIQNILDLINKKKSNTKKEFGKKHFLKILNKKVCIISIAIHQK